MEENITPNGLSVLCIEDEEYISELYDRALSHAGYNVKVIADGVEALNEALKNTYDIILLDLMIPNLTGVEILKQLKDKNRKVAIKAKVIIITNLEQTEDDRQKIEALADGYLVKAAFTPHELVDYVAALQ